MLNRDSEIVICSRFVSCELRSCDMNSTLGSVVPLAMFIPFSHQGPHLCPMLGSIDDGSARNNGRKQYDCNRLRLELAMQLGIMRNMRENAYFAYACIFSKSA